MSPLLAIPALAFAGASLFLQTKTYRKIKKMNQVEQDKFAELNTKIDGHVAAHKATEAELAQAKADLVTANATIADLTAKLAAVPPADDGADVVAAIGAAEAKLDAENPAPVPDPAPAA